MSLIICFVFEDEEGVYLWVWIIILWILFSNFVLVVYFEVIYVKVKVVEIGEIVYFEFGCFVDY